MEYRFCTYTSHAVPRHIHNYKHVYIHTGTAPARACAPARAHAPARTSAPCRTCAHAVHRIHTVQCIVTQYIQLTDYIQYIQFSIWLEWERRVGMKKVRVVSKGGRLDFTLAGAQGAYALVKDLKNAALNKAIDKLIEESDSMKTMTLEQCLQG